MKNSKDKIIIVLLLIIIILLAGYIILNLNKDSKAKDFISDFTKLQSNISYYIGSTYSDTFGVYTNEEIITGTKTANDNDIENIEPIVDTKSKIEKNAKVSYQILSENVKKIFKVDVPNYEGVKWYIQDGEFLKVDFETKPSWWTDNLESYRLGK